MEKIVKNRNSLLYKILQKPYERFLKIRGQPREIALGFALGLFIGMTPTLGSQMVIAIFFAALFKWNKISSAIGVWITNPITAPFIYSLTYMIGARVMGLRNSFRLSDIQNIGSLIEIIKKTPEILVALTIGGFILGLPLAVLGYYLSYSTIQRYREEIKRKLLKQKERIARLKEKRKVRKSKRAKAKKAKKANKKTV